MATKTTNYNLTKPSYNESADISVINQNMDIIDEKMKEIENASGGGGTSVTVDRELSTTSENPVQNKVITQALNDKGTYSKPTGGIPKTDLASEVQTSLGKADTALQEHQDISGKADKTEVTAIFNSISDAWNSANAYTVGQYCIYNNALWKCLVANTNTEPAEGTYWTQTTIDAEISAVNSNFVNGFRVVEYDTSENSIGEDIQISYPNGFQRHNCVPIGISGYHKNYGVWYTYLNSNIIQVTLANSIIAIVNSDYYVGNGAKIRIVLMKI